MGQIKKKKQLQKCFSILWIDTRTLPHIQMDRWAPVLAWVSMLRVLRSSSSWSSLLSPFTQHCILLMKVVSPSPTIPHTGQPYKPGCSHCLVLLTTRISSLGETFWVMIITIFSKASNTISVQSICVARKCSNLKNGWVTVKKVRKVRKYWVTDC